MLRWLGHVGRIKEVGEENSKIRCEMCEVENVMNGMGGWMDGWTV